MKPAERCIDGSKLEKPPVETQGNVTRELRIDGRILEQFDIPTIAQAAFTARWSSQDIDSIHAHVANDSTTA